MTKDYWVNALIHLQYSSLPSLRWQPRQGNWNIPGGVYVAVDGTNWALLGNIGDLNSWTDQQVIDQVYNALNLKKGDETAPMPASSEEARSAGEESATLWTALLANTQLPNNILYKFARKIAKYDGFVGDAAFDYVEGFVSMFGVYRSANKSLMPSQRLEMPDD